MLLQLHSLLLLQQLLADFWFASVAAAVAAAAVDSLRTHLDAFRAAAPAAHRSASFAFLASSARLSL